MVCQSRMTTLAYVLVDDMSIIHKTDFRTEFACDPKFVFEVLSEFYHPVLPECREYHARYYPNNVVIYLAGQAFAGG